MKTFVVLLAILMLTACSRAPQPEGRAPAASTTPALAASAMAPTAGAAAPAASTLLTQYHWQLSGATDKAGQRIDALFARAGKPLQLDFDARGISITNTCNGMRGPYSLTDGQLEIGNLAATMKACADPKLMALDDAAAKYLHGTLAFRLDAGGANPGLTLGTAQGDTLTFAGEPTAKTRYGSEGETMFLEVAPQTEACNNPGMPNAQCLKVRELHYGSNGIRAGNPGPWHVLGQGIEGFSHESGTRNVLRVKRYPVANPPADASSVAYVLDMVVESESPSHQ